MGRGKRWTQQENDLLMKLVKKGLTAEQIFQSGKFEGRTVRAIAKQIERLSIVRQRKKVIVRQIRPVDILTLEEVLKRFSDAYQQICEPKEFNKLELERFRIIFTAAKAYGPLLAEYERWVEVETRLARLEKMVEEISARQPGKA